MRLQYKYPRLYQLLIPLIHRRSVLKEFSKEVGKDSEVLDIAAGFGQMARYIDGSNTYKGVDLNKKYIEFGRNQGRDLRLGNIFHKNSYRRSDTLILVDVIHHMPPERLSELFDLVYAHAKQRVVILEPAFLNLKKKYSVFGAAVDWMFKKLDDDGINKIEHWMSEAEYQRLFENRFGSPEGNDFSLRVKKIYPYFIVTFAKSPLKTVS